MTPAFPNRTLQRILGVALGAYFVLASGSELVGVSMGLPGFSPVGVDHTLRLGIDIVAIVSAGCLMMASTRRYAAAVMGAMWVGRSIWDMTGGQSTSALWVLIFALLALVAAPTRGSSSA
jgi:hypothetical protein